MKIALAQIASIDGDVDANIARHLSVLGQLRAGDAGLVIFPELSLANYQPEIAARAAIEADDERLAPLAAAARELQAAICVGVPLITRDKPSISALLLPPASPRIVIHKAYLHDDEVPYFSAGVEQATVLDLAQRVALAICFDISVDAHIEQAAAAGMEVYVASVAKTANGIAAARERLRLKARAFGLPVLVVNSVGSCEGKPAGGGSLFIGADGESIESLDGSEQALLICDLEHARAHRLPLDLSRR